MSYPRAFEELIENLKKLPGVGPKSAERMAYQIINMKDVDLKELSDCLGSIKSKLHYCSKCGLLTDDDTCSICNNSTRDNSILCVVQTSKDAFAIEKTKSFNGVFHVLNGTISPLNGIGPEDLNIESLIKRVSSGSIKEVILATNPNTEGETTALYLSKLLSKYDVEVSRIAYGLPVGANIDYTDEFTLLRAIQGRRKI